MRMIVLPLTNEPSFTITSVPGIHGQVTALIGRVDANAMLVGRSGIAQVGPVTENLVNGDTTAIVATDQITGGRTLGVNNS
jgi:hypothetical protein